MKVVKRKPCKECPFKNNCAPGWLGPWKKAEQLHNYVMAEHKLACHMTVKEDGVDSDEVENCVGSILYMNRNFKLARNTEIKKLQDLFRNEDKSGIMTSPEFFKRHSFETV